MRVFHPNFRTMQRGLGLVLIVGIVVWPVTPIWSAPSMTSNPINLGLMSLGGTATASSNAPSLTAALAFDGVFFGESKGSAYESGWVARSGVGAWIERVWPGRVELTGVKITRRSNYTITDCSKARDLAINLGGGQSKKVRLADSNSSQYFSLSTNSVRSLRITVESVEGEVCSAGAVGFAEVEIYGWPKNWTPITMTTSQIVQPTITIPDNQLTFAYDAKIPATTQAYLNEFTTTVGPVMTEVLGPPLTSQNLVIKLDPAYGSFTYAAGLGTITISRLPNVDLQMNDPANWDFNANLLHELAHAYQAGYGAGAPAWWREGFAQAAAELVKNVFIERGNKLSENTTMSEGAAVRAYDAMAAMGPEVLEAAWDGNSRIIPYMNATGLWWLLILSQSSPRPNGLYTELDFLKRVEAGLYQASPDNTFAGRRAFLSYLSPNPIDGLPVSQWLMRQPIVQGAPYQTALGFYPGDCFCANNVAAEAQHLIIFAHGQLGTVGAIPLRVTLRDADGNIRSDETVTYTDYGFGFYYYTFPILIQSLPNGRYDVTIEATIDGRVLRPTQSIARGSYSVSGAGGLSVTQAQASAIQPLSLTTPIGDYQSASLANGRLLNLPAQPLELQVSVNNRTVAEKIFWPAPYTRYINLP